MRNYAKFSLLMAFAMLYGCRSHRAIEEATFVANDSCNLESSVNVQRLTDIIAIESVDSISLHDHFDFEDGAGVIQILPDGEVTIKGLKSASLTRNAKCQTSDIQISSSDSLFAESHSKSSSAIESNAKTRRDIPISKSNWLKYLLLVISILICVLLSLQLLKAKLKH